MRVPEFLSFRKEPGRTVLLSLVIILVGLSSFALGRLSALESRNSSQSGIRLVGEGDAGAIGASGAAGEGMTSGASAAGAAVAGGVVASKSGTKYHFPWCAGAQSIKESNKVWFASTAQARAAGYEPASNCKGLQ